jgi:hypothetical protein
MKYTLLYNGKLVDTYDSFEEASRKVEDAIGELMLDGYSLEREDGVDCELHGNANVYIEAPE